MMEKPLKDARVGERLLICKLYCKEDICKRLRDIGMVEGTQVECVGFAPFGDPAAFLIRGAVIALRRQDTEKIWAEVIE